MRTEKEVKRALATLSTWPKDSGYYGGYRNALRYVLEEAPLDNMLQDGERKMFERDAILKGCGRPRKGVSEQVWCTITDEPCNMPDDTPDCPLWIEASELETKKRKEKL